MSQRSLYQFAPEDETSLGVVLPIAVSVAYWFGVTGTSPIEALLATTSFVTISVVGYLSLKTVGVSFENLRTRIWTALGPGLAVGLFILFMFRAIVSRQVFVWTYLFLVLLSFLLLVHGVYNHASGWILRKDLATRGIVGLWRLPAAIAVVGLILHREWWWNLPIVVAALLSAASLRSCRTLRSRLIVIPLVLLLIAVATRWGTSIRSELWWVSSSNNDDPFFEAWARSLVEWGPLIDPLVASGNGLSAAAYHHLAYFLVGLISYTADTATFVALSRTVPVMLAASVGFSFLLFLSAIREASRVIVLTAKSELLVTILFFVSVSLAHPLSDFLASGLLIGILALASRGVADSTRTLVGFSVLSVGATMFSKTAYVFATVLILCVVVIRQTRSWRRTLVPLITGLAFVSAFAVNSANSSMFYFDFLSEVSVGEHAFGGPIHKLLAVVFVLMPISFSLAAVLEVARGSDTSRRVHDVLIAALSVMFCGILLQMFLGVAITRIASYFVRPVYLMAALMVTVAVLSVGSSSLRRSTFIAMGLTCSVASLIWGLVIPEVIPNLNQGSAYAKVFRLLRDPQFLGMIVFLVAISWPYFVKDQPTSFRSNERPMISRTLASVVLPALVASVGLLGILDRVDERRSETTSGLEDEINLKVLGGDTLREVSLQLRRKSEPENLAAYTICDFTAQEHSCTSPNLISAYSGRRFLHLVGLSDFLGFSSSEEEADFRLSAQLLEMSATNAISRLHERGVSFVILDRPRVSPQWISQAEQDGALVVFQNAEFLLLKVGGTWESH